MGFVLVLVTNVLCGARETVISRDRWLVVVTVAFYARYEYVLSVTGIYLLPFLAHL
jgi:hypothetical protein